MKYNFKYIILLCFIALLANTMNAQKSPTAIQMEKLGLVDVRQIDSTLKVDLMYAKSNNFTGRILYKDLREALLHPTAAKALGRAQKLLQQHRPELTLLICDAARPMHIQQQMWNIVSHTSKRNYVSNPRNGGGLHNYGMAVDVTLCHRETGEELDMGTSVDYLGEKSHINQEKLLVQKGLISPQAKANRELLRAVMQEAGFKPLRTEWWHFNFITRAEAKAHYKAIP